MSVLFFFLAKYLFCGMRMPQTWDCGGTKIAVPLHCQKPPKLGGWGSEQAQASHRKNIFGLVLVCSDP